MNYFISRDGQQYGPYTLADLQRYTASGEVLVSDLATSDALTEPVTVGQIIGTIAAPPSFSVANPASAMPIYPDPPNLNWGLVLLFSVMTCGVFTIVWEIVQAAWLKRIEPESKALYLYSAAGVTLGLIMVTSFLAGINHSQANFRGIFRLIYTVLSLLGRFHFRSSMENHFTEAEPMGLSLNGVMTFFFGGIYFQYHINDIVRRKQADRIYEMSR